MEKNKRYADTLKPSRELQTYKECINQEYDHDILLSLPIGSK